MRRGDEKLPTNSEIVRQGSRPGSAATQVAWLSTDDMTSLTALVLAPLDLPGGAADLTEHSGHAGDFMEPLPGLEGSRNRAEDTVRQILAERFAHRDLSAEEFMGRASALSWTPGVTDVRPSSVGRV